MTEGTDARIKREPNFGRRSREEDDREVAENRELNEDDRLEMFRQHLFNDALPDLPPIEGFHTCWLTTTNPRDSIHRRMQIGYTPIRADEVPGMEYTAQQTGEWEGMIGINEMLAFKLPLSLYHKFMQEAHHIAPAREEEALAQNADRMREEAMRSGANIIEEEGMADMRNSAPSRGIFVD